MTKKTKEKINNIVIMTFFIKCDCIWISKFLVLYVSVSVAAENSFSLTLGMFVCNGSTVLYCTVMVII